MDRSHPGVADNALASFSAQEKVNARQVMRANADAVESCEDNVPHGATGSSELNGVPL